MVDIEFNHWGVFEIIYMNVTRKREMVQIFEIMSAGFVCLFAIYFNFINHGYILFLQGIYFRPYNNIFCTNSTKNLRIFVTIN